MQPYLNTNTKPLPTAPLNLSHHLSNSLGLMHQLRPETISASPALRTAAVDVDAVAVGLNEGCGAGEFEWGASGELGD